MKAGTAEEEQPKVVFPTMIGRPKHKKVLPSDVDSNFFVAPPEKLRGLMNISYPMEHGIIKDFDDMKAIWNHIYSELKLSKKEHPVILTESPFNPRSNRAEMAEIFFENYNVPALFIGQQAALGLSAFGKTTGLVVDSGDGVTQVVPIYEGYAIEKGIERINLGGRDITEYFRLLLRRAGYNFVTSSEFELVKTIKETMIECAESASDLENLLKKNDKDTKTHPYYLPDGSKLTIHQERYMAPEMLFNPEKMGFEFPGIHELVHSSLRKTDVDLRQYLYREILLAGGNTEISKFPKRFVEDLSMISPKEVKVKVHAPPERSKAAWIGASIICNIATFKPLWVSKAKYNEQGDRIFDTRDRKSVV